MVFAGSGGLFASAKHKKNAAKLKNLEDLSKLGSLEGVDPKLVGELINERTKEVNIKREREFLKEISKGNRRPLMSTGMSRVMWGVLISGAVGYMIYDSRRGHRQYKEREDELQIQIEQLEKELRETMARKKKANLSGGGVIDKDQNGVGVSGGDGNSKQFSLWGWFWAK